MSQPWIAAWAERRPESRVRLFCFPYAGGGATVFRQWSAALPGSVEVRPIQLPGREARQREAPVRRMETLAERMAEALRPELDRPFAFFGHSLGAMVAYALACRLRREGLPQPARLLVSACRAPHLPRDRPPLHALPDDALVREVAIRYRPIPAPIAREPDLLALLLPALRGDLALLESYDPPAEPPLDVAVTAFAGSHDRAVDLAGVDAWAERTRAGFRRHLLAGDHFFLESARPELLRLLALDLAGMERRQGRVQV